MPPPPGRGLSTKELVIGLLFIAGTAALQKPQHHYPATNAPGASSLAQQNDDPADAAAAAAADAPWQAPHAEPLQHHLAGQRGHRDTNANVINNEACQDTQNVDHNNNSNNKKQKARWTAHVNERALATVSPAGSDSAVRAPPAQWSASSNADPSSRHLQARNLQDWQVEQTILLATVDGKLHARDRRTGTHRWTVQNDHDMVEVTRHPHNKTLNPDGTEQEAPMFIVEPCQDGELFLLAPEQGLTRLEDHSGPITVKKLAELSPYSQEGSNVVYTAEKKNRLNTINAQNGVVVKTFTSTGSIPGEDSSCRRVHPLNSLADDNELETTGFITLGQTEYTIGIQDRITGHTISTIKFFEWTPNNRDQDLRNSYVSTPDRRNLYSTWDAHFYSLRHDFNDLERKKTEFWGKLNAPMARVYDIMRPVTDRSGSADLVALQQPLDRIQPGAAGPDAVYVNQTANGNWYALSERHYPGVTDKARPVLHLDQARFSSMDIAGVYNTPRKATIPLVDGGTPFTIDAPPSESGDERFVDNDNGRPDLSALPFNKQETSYINVQNLILAVVTLLCLAASPYALKNDSLRALLPRPATASISVPVAEPIQIAVDVPEKVLAEAEPTTPVMVRESEPATETIFPHDSPRSEGPAPSKVRFAEPEGPEQPGDESPEGEEIKDEPKKKKATRGRRGGRKQKEKEAAQAEARSKKPSAEPPKAQVISVAASESPEVAGWISINSLAINTQAIIGRGSCGTQVFEGMFETRRVAVKRMLCEYYDLASQEVSFLQQSDDHDNVIRYFCQQKDNHFLYIAVELCQASLFEVWKPFDAKTDERREHLLALKTSIQQDVMRTLKQLANGLNHLHELRIIHRDIKPQNILVAFPKKTQAPGTNRLVISDFGLGKNLPQDMSTVQATGNAGTSGWKAPELITMTRESENSHSRGASNESGEVVGASGVKRAADIFSLGCLFFWVLTDGIHPYESEGGYTAFREWNIKHNKRNLEPLSRWSDAYEPMQLIGSMLAYEPANRPGAHEVLHHPYFWEPETRLLFLCDCSDHFEREPRGTWDNAYAGDSDNLKLLENRLDEIVGSRCDFLSKLDKVFVDSLGKQRKYSGNRVLDLLRAFRNKKNHYEDMPEHVKRLVGPLPDGYLSYWTNRFPRLLMACHEVVREAGLMQSDRFKRYYGL